MDARDWAEKRKPYIEGKRNDHVYLVAQRCKEKGVSQEMTLFFARRDFTDLPDYEIVSTVKSAYNHTPETKPRTPSKRRETDVAAVIAWLIAHYNGYYSVIDRALYIRAKGEAKYHLYDHLRDGSIIWVQLQEAGIPCRRDDLKSILYSALSKDFNPIEDFFYNWLEPWDEQTDYLTVVTGNFETADQDFFVKTFEKWTVGMIACALDPKAHNPRMLILSSPEQGIGKTRFMSHFLPEPLEDFYSEGVPPDLGSKDVKFLMERNMLINLDELKALTTEKEKNNLKALLTMTQPMERRVYGEKAEKLTLRASFCATVNDPKVISDIDGSRRHYIHIVTNIRDYDMPVPPGFWAQALYKWQHGFPYWDTKEDIDDVMRRNEAFRQISLEEGLVRDYIRKPDDLHPGVWLSASQIVKKLTMLSGLNLDRRSLFTIARVLTKEDFPIKVSHNQNIYRVVFLSHEQLEADALA